MCLKWPRNLNEARSGGCVNRFKGVGSGSEARSIAVAKIGVDALALSTAPPGGAGRLGRPNEAPPATITEPRYPAL